MARTNRRCSSCDQHLLSFLGGCCWDCTLSVARNNSGDFLAPLALPPRWSTVTGVTTSGLLLITADCSESSGKEAVGLSSVMDLAASGGSPLNSDNAAPLLRFLHSKLLCSSCLRSTTPSFCNQKPDHPFLEKSLEDTKKHLRYIFFPVKIPSFHLFSDCFIVIVVLDIIIAPELDRTHPVHLIFAIAFHFYPSVLTDFTLDRNEFLDYTSETLAMAPIDLPSQFFDHCNRNPKKLFSHHNNSLKRCAKTMTRKGKHRTDPRKGDACREGARV